MTGKVKIAWKLRFLGATHQVTGSSYFLEAGGLKILVDCGMFQERDYSHRNWEAFPASPDQIQYLLLTHVHQDHSGLIPKLVKEGFAGDILLTPASKELFPIIVLDSARIQEEDAAFKKRRHDKEGRKDFTQKFLYTRSKMRKSVFPSLRLFPMKNFYRWTTKSRSVSTMQVTSLARPWLRSLFKMRAGPRNIIFSGDIGQWDKPLLNNPSVFDQADYVVMECTYGDRDHEGSQEMMINSVRS